MTAFPPAATPRPPAAPRRTGRAARVAAVCAALTGVLAGCGAGDPDAGTNGVGKLPAATIESKAQAAAKGADSVHLSGNVVSQGGTYKLDMRLAKNGARGELSTKAAGFQLLRIGDALYLKADAAFWAGEKGGSGSASATAAKLGGKYVKVPAADPVYQRFSGFTDKDTLLAGLLGLHGALTVGEHGSVSGVRTVRLTAGAGSGGNLDVSLEGAPYPLRLQRAGGAGEVRLDDWGKSVDLKTPDDSQVVDYGKQIPGAG
ncbi:lipoprotein [Streptomyces albospinus]|uniref:Lipoprotein n=1 Tax=Streptomyces albospinus TaxID=285515 RepID=A0ABQ2UMF8_9ACTN|nr:lipoprotein [Streptomyces albospinus]